MADNGRFGKERRGRGGGHNRRGNLQRNLDAQRQQRNGADAPVAAQMDGRPQRGRGHGKNRRGNLQRNLEPQRQPRNGANVPAEVGDQHHYRRGAPAYRGCQQRTAVPREPRPMRYTQMNDLLVRPPTEVLFTLMNPAQGFQKLITQNDLNLDKLVLILALLARACDSDQLESKRTFLKSTQALQQFAIVNLVSYLCEMQNLTHAQQMDASLGNLLTFLEVLQELEPDKSVSTLTILLPQLKETLSVMGDRVHKDLSLRTQDLDLKKNLYKERYSVSFLEVKQMETPPNDFRAIPLFPDASDIINCRPFLRPNIVEGRYQDTEHYLDVQYRLLREDFVRPLRDGISVYKRNLKNQEKQLKLQDVRIYNNVQFTDVALTRDGVVHVVRFDANPFKRVRWETNKRLIFGSFLCFSQDHFETMMFGTVAERKAEDLARGKLSVCLQDHRTIPEMQKVTATFVMLETSAYFEAYRYNLIALQSMSDRTLSCFKEFIVEMSHQVGPPQYLECASSQKNYLFPKMHQTFQDKLNDAKYLKETATFSKKHYAKIDESGYCKPCEILNDSSWPSCNELGLDDSQFSAFKTALTKKLAIIQGPPGTGKTYVGLKVIHTLLHNTSVWKTNPESGPILVICYTNHALDQFLEGISEFTQSIVRIGGRCQSEFLSEFTIRSLKRSLAIKRERPRYLHQTNLYIQHELEDIISEMDRLRQNFKECEKSVLSEDDLQVVMDEIHYLSFIEACPKFMAMCDPLMPYWLELAWPGIEYDAANYDIEQNIDEVLMNSIPTAKNDQELDDSDNVGDVEYETNMRTDGDDYANARIIRAKPRVTAKARSVFNPDGWKVQGGKKQIKKRLTNLLQKCTPMPAEEMELITNVWNLSVSDKQRMYKAWVEQYKIYVAAKLEELNFDYQSKIKTAMELICEQDLQICKEKEVVAMTTTGAAKYRTLVNQLKPQIVIVEEAAEVMEAHIVTALTECTEHLILIGDHQQLRPNPTVYELAKRYKLDVSLFERFVNNGLPFCQLRLQHRMKPCISKLLVPHIYENLEDHSSVKEYEDINGMEKSMFFYNHESKELSERDSTSRMNVLEAEFLMKLCRYLLLQGYCQKQITILTTYTGQMFLLKRLMTDEMFRDVRITVVDNFQGEENDIILLSLVRSNEEGSVGFLKVNNRVCVALSRAKKGLYCVGNFDLLKEKSKLWGNICEELMIADSVGNNLNVRCQNHGKIVSIKEPSDFEKVVDGGCSDPCDFRLSCGHSCHLLCHPYDQDHVEYKCNKMCDKVICELGHTCPKACHKPCGPCEVLVPKILVPCGHEARVACQKSPSEVNCLLPCSKKLNCGHECQKRCFEQCGTCTVVITVHGRCGHDIIVDCGISHDELLVQTMCLLPCERQLLCKHACTNRCGTPCIQGCKVKVEFDSPCGHTVKVQCHETESEEKVLNACKHVCGMTLECGHLCSGTCSSCYQGRLHTTCKEPCNRLLVCGHVCKEPCSKSCPPCNRMCENRCSHSKCRAPCGFPCTPCKERCIWKCIHHECSKKCGELCNRPPCSKPCEKILKCKHECTGICGEPCPKLCRICDKDELTEIFFGDEDEPGARFIMLEDCNHIFEEMGLKQWIESESCDEFGEIKLLSCPICKMPIRRNLHFSTKIKTCISHVEKVKLKSLGQLEKIQEKREDIQRILQTKHFNIWTICMTGGKQKDLLLKRLDTTLTTFIISNIVDELKKQKNVSLPFLIQMENLLNIVQEFIKIEKKVKLIKVDSAWLFFINSSMIDVRTIIINKFTTVSDQLVLDINWELRRLHLLTNFIKDFQARCGLRTSNDKVLFKTTANVLMMRKGFREEQEKEFLQMRKKLCESIGGACIGISQDEKVQILKAMALTQGHWYSCPNGHVYCITECGGATVEGRCNECNAAIGGGNHRLRSDNRVATAMDGARHSAWSEAHNLENFNINDIL